MKESALDILIAMETTRGSIPIYLRAVSCCHDAVLKDNCKIYLHQAKQLDSLLISTCEQMGIDPHAASPVSRVFRKVTKVWLRSIDLAVTAGAMDLAELLSCEAMMLIETLHQETWTLLAQLAASNVGREHTILQNTVDTERTIKDRHQTKQGGLCKNYVSEPWGLHAFPPTSEAQRSLLHREMT